MMNKTTPRTVLLAVFLFACGAIAVAGPAVAKKPLERNLIGRWDLKWGGNLGNNPDRILYVTETAIVGGYVLGSGCMQTVESELFAPLSLQALPTSNGSYALVIVSSDIPSVGQPAVLQLSGDVSNLGKSRRDDTAVGATPLPWTATHVDGKRFSCPPAPLPPLQFNADVRVHHNYSVPNTSPVRLTQFAGSGTVVSTGMQITWPDGTVQVAPPFADDIFSLNVDFSTQFRYILNVPNTDPVVGQTYSFVLLDGVGKPIPGTERTDIWTGCGFETESGASYPTDLVTLPSGNDLVLRWTGVGPFPGFDPTNGEGFYQISMDKLAQPRTEVFGSNLIKSGEHLIPSSPFIQGSLGTPDGNNFGKSLSELDDGATYEIRVSANSVPAEDDPGNGLECVIQGPSRIQINKANGVINLPQ